MKTIILAGGKGTRLWPLSREMMPKQFLKIFGNSLFQKTVQRAFIFSKPDEIFVVTNKEYKFRVLDDLEEIGVKIPDENLILEPKAMNTLPAICLAIKNGGNGKFAVLPSDHIVEVNESYINAFKVAEKVSDDYLVTFGIKPTKPHTGYGYIKPGERIGDAFKVEDFKEKPDSELAKIYVDMGYLWNSGMFILDSRVFIEEIEKHAPDMLEILEKGEEAYDKVREISIDYGLLEKSKRVAVVPMETKWSDVGNFDAIYDLWEKDSDGNAVSGEAICMDARNNLVVSQKLAVLAGVEDLIVVNTDDAVLVAKRGRGEMVKRIYEKLREKKDKRAEIHRTAHRPWGSYKMIEEGQGYRVKRLIIRPKKRISLQRHYHRSEHWVVVRGIARITVDGKEILLRSGESTFVPAGAVHRIENPGKIPLEIIEIQIGEYIEEDDIERFEDDFGRC